MNRETFIRRAECGLHEDFDVLKLDLESYLQEHPEDRLLGIAILATEIPSNAFSLVDKIKRKRRFYLGWIGLRVLWVQFFKLLNFLAFRIPVVTLLAISIGDFEIWELSTWVLVGFFSFIPEIFLKNSEYKSYLTDESEE